MKGKIITTEHVRRVVEWVDQQRVNPQAQTEAWAEFGKRGGDLAAGVQWTLMRLVEIAEEEEARPAIAAQKAIHAPPRSHLERLAGLFRRAYQQEARRQAKALGGRVVQVTEYGKLPESAKDYDRALARAVLAALGEDPGIRLAFVGHIEYQLANTTEE
jgi:hypothetical protein